MEQGKKLIERFFISAQSLVRFVNLNRIEQQQIVQIVKMSSDGLYLFFYRDSPLEFDKLTDLFDSAFINDLNDNKRCLVKLMRKEGCYIIPTSIKDKGSSLSKEEWIELLCEYNDTEDYQSVR